MNGKLQLNVTVLNDTFCISEDNPKPDEFVDCNTFPCFYRWTTGKFEEVL